jgi:putative ABC transport system permease protein
VWIWVRLERIELDFRCGLRALRNAPGFTALAVLTLALGIGANAAIFSLVGAVLFRALPYRDSGRLVWLTNFVPSQAQDFVFQNVYAAWRDQSHVLETIGAYLPPTEYTVMAERVRGAQVTPSFLDVLGVTPQLGRNFLPDEGRPGGPKAVLLSDAIWRSRFSADPGVAGRVIAVDGNAYAIVGVLPRDFEFLDRSPLDLLIPFQFADSAIQTVDGRVVIRIESMQVVARLRPGAQESAVMAELNQINEIVLRSVPAKGKQLLTGAHAEMISLHDREVGDERPALLVLFATVGFLLLITCANVANMQLARAVARERDVAIRTVLGAGRWRVIRGLLIESLTVALAGGATALLLAAWAIRLTQRFAPTNVSHLQSARLDGRVLLFTLGVSVLTGIMFGLAPVLAASRVSLNETLKQAAPQSGISAGARRAQRALAVVEIALSFVLFIGAGLLVKSFRQLTAIPLGFDPHGVLTARVALPRDQYQSFDQRRAFFNQLVTKLQALPGVASAGATAWIPLRGVTMFSLIGIEGQPRPDFSWANVPSASVNAVTPGYFAALRVPLIEGRLLDERDGVDAPNYVVVNRAFVRRFLPSNEDPIGKGFNCDVGGKQTDGPQTATIVGVIGDTREEGLARKPIPEVTVSALQWPRFVMTLVLRTSTDPVSLVSGVRTQVRDLDNGLPIYDVHTMDEVLSAEVVSQRFNAGAVAGFAGLAVLLASIGIYGVMAYAVSQRTHEMGVRMALGAAPGKVLRMVLNEGLRLALIGVGLGILASVGLTPLMRRLLFGVKSSDPETYLLVIAAFLAVVLVACYIPSWRATRVDPVVALRYD